MIDDDEDDESLIELIRGPGVKPLDTREANRPSLPVGLNPVHSELHEIFMALPEIRHRLSVREFNDLCDMKNNGIKYKDEAELVHRLYKELDVFKLIWRKKP